jgi:hypothetical protein
MPPKKKKSTASTDTPVAMATDSPTALPSSSTTFDDAALSALLASSSTDWAAHERAGLLESHLWPRVLSNFDAVSVPLAQSVVALLSVKALTHAAPDAAFGAPIEFSN